MPCIISGQNEYQGNLIKQFNLYLYSKKTVGILKTGKS